MTTTTLTSGGASDFISLSNGDDGTLTVKVGPTGAKVNALVFDAAGTPTFLKQAVLPVQSMVAVNNHAGYGSTNNRIRIFGNNTNGVNGCVIQGADITYATSATLGDTFTTNTAGVYAVTTCYSSGTDTNQGISKNSTQLSTDVSIIAPAERLASARPGTTTGTAQCVSISWVGYLAAGSIVRAHGDATIAANNALSNFTITRVA